MNSEETVPLTKMDKIRIVVEYNELEKNQKEAYLKKHKIGPEKMEAYQKEAASIIGIKHHPPLPKTRCEELIEQLASSNEDARRGAAKELGHLRHRSIPAVDSLIDRMLNDHIDFVRAWSSWALTRIEPRNPSVIEGFLQCVETEEHSVNARNWSIVGLTVSDSEHAQNRLIQILQTGKPFAQHSAIEILLKIGVKSSGFIEALKNASTSDNASLQKRAHEALSQIQPEPEG